MIFFPQEILPIPLNAYILQQLRIHLGEQRPKA
jgi:hypothetical protein